MQEKFGAELKDWESLLDYIGPTDLLPIVSDPSVKPSPSSKIKSIGKVPSIVNMYGYAVGLTGWTDRLSTKEDVAHWKNSPRYGIGIHCRNIKALDVDIDDFMVSVDVMGMFSAITGGAVNYRSRSNSSRVLIPFLCDDPFGKIVITGKNEEHKIEILSNGNQFVAYGTHTSGARYEWSREDWPACLPYLSKEMVDELSDKLTKYLDGTITRAGERLPRVLGDATFDQSNLSTDPVYNKLSEEGMILGQREDGIFDIECPFDYLHSKGQAGDSSTQYRAMGTNGYKESSIICLHTHGEGHSMIDYAKKLGVEEEYINAVERLNAAQQLAGLEIIPDDPEDVVKSNKLKSEVDITTLFHDDNIYGIINEETRTKWLINGVLAQKSLSMMYGPPAVGKSFLIMDMAYSIASGAPFADRHRTDTKGKVLYVAAEGADGVRKRVNVLRTTRGWGIGPDSESFIKIYTGSVNLVSRENTGKFIDQVRSAMGDSPPVCIVFDTLAANMIGDENNSKDGAMVVASCKRIINELNTSVLLVHHSGKNSELGARGWSGFKGAVDAELVVNLHDNGVRSLRVSKNKDDISGSEYAFKLESVPTGVDVIKYKRKQNPDGSYGFIERDEIGEPIEIVSKEYSMVVNWRDAELPVSKPVQAMKQHSAEMAVVIDIMRQGHPDKSMKMIADQVQGLHPDINTAKVKSVVGELISLGRMRSSGGGLSDATYSLIEEETGVVPDLYGEETFDTS